MENNKNFKYSGGFKEKRKNSAPQVRKFWPFTGGIQGIYIDFRAPEARQILEFQKIRTSKKVILPKNKNQQNSEDLIQKIRTVAK